MTWTQTYQPLGATVGNSLEILECIEIMHGEKNPLSADLIELSIELSAWIDAILIQSFSVVISSSAPSAAALRASWRRSSGK